ncbi:MAG TPA: molecular chaperone TorD family protein [Acidiferrobacterales bacterium]|nr:molecular chaperone TorD family protein [Acidiferrobacterales bacterium]
MAPGNTAFTSRAEFYLCLARAFLPPRAPQTHRALVEDLADALADLAVEIGYPIFEPLAQLRAAFGAVPEPLALLQLYSKLFLTPPAAAALNAGMYLDGAVMGASVGAIGQAYRHHGLARAEGFRDTPDHLASLLEFVAYLYAAAAETPAEAETLAEEAEVFLDCYVTSWLPPLCAHIARAVPGDANPYAVLARLLLDAANQDARRTEPAVARPGPPATPAPDSGPEERTPLPHCRACGAAALDVLSLAALAHPCATEFVPPSDLRYILRALQANGLGTEHLHMCPRCRDHAVTTASRRATPSLR